MKKLLVITVILSFTAVACDAFKESYDNMPTATTVPTGGTNNNEGKKPSGGQGVIDYTSDKTVCEVIADVNVEKSEGANAITVSELSVAADGEEVKASAEKIGAYTTKVTVTAGDKELQLILKQTGEKEFSICSAVYGDMQVKSGKITVEQFNAGEDLTKAVNSGSFSLVFQAKTAAVKAAVDAIGDLAGASGDVTVEGTYYVEGLTESAI